MVYERVQPAAGAEQGRSGAFKRGDQVAYFAPHNPQDISHPETEFGFVTGVLEESPNIDETVVVAFWRDDGEVYTAGCYTWCLAHYQSKPQSEVARWLEKIP